MIETRFSSILNRTPNNTGFIGLYEVVKNNDLDNNRPTRLKDNYMEYFKTTYELDISTMPTKPKTIQDAYEGIIRSISSAELYGKELNNVNLERLKILHNITENATPFSKFPLLRQEIEVEISIKKDEEPLSDKNFSDYTIKLTNKFTQLTGGKVIYLTDLHNVNKKRRIEKVQATSVNTIGTHLSYTCSNPPTKHDAIQVANTLTAIIKKLDYIYENGWFSNFNDAVIKGIKCTRCNHQQCRQPSQCSRSCSVCISQTRSNKRSNGDSFFPPNNNNKLQHDFKGRGPTNKKYPGDNNSDRVHSIKHGEKYDSNADDSQSYQDKNSSYNNLSKDNSQQPTKVMHTNLTVISKEYELTNQNNYTDKQPSNCTISKYHKSPSPTSKNNLLTEINMNPTSININVISKANEPMLIPNGWFLISSESPKHFTPFIQLLVNLKTIKKPFNITGAGGETISTITHVGDFPIDIYKGKPIYLRDVYVAEGLKCNIYSPSYDYSHTEYDSHIDIALETGKQSYYSTGVTSYQTKRSYRIRNENFLQYFEIPILNPTELVISTIANIED